MERKTLKKILPKSKDREGMECPICCIEYAQESNFHCHSCQINHCMGCMKKYLLDTTQDPHCMNCRTAITYDQLMKLTDKNWRLKTYKKRREEILMEREQSKFPETVGHLANLRKASLVTLEIDQLMERRRQLDEQIALLNYQVLELQGKTSTKKDRVVYQWVQACPSKDCRGFLNKDFDCPVCNVTFCKDCLLPETEGHTCDAELVETLKEIKKDAKPCPTCGEFISKISGCNQMFCTGCGTAFDWNTGQKEVGIIHNPHAFDYFQRNPEQRELYQQQRTRNQNPDGACRPLIPDYRLVNLIPMEPSWKNLLMRYRTNIWNVHEYGFPRYDAFVANQDRNLDIRMKYIQKEYSDKDFKKTLHQREKRRHYVSMILPILRNTYDVFANYVWAIVDSKDITEIQRIFQHINELRGDTNEIFNKISTDLSYTSCVMIGPELVLDGLHLR